MDKIYKENTEQAELGTRQFFSFRDKGQQDNDFWASAISLSLSSSIFLAIPTLSLLSSSFPYSRVLIQSSSFPFPHNSPVFSVHVLSLSFLVHSKYSSIPSPFFPVLVLSLTVPLMPYLSLSIPSLFLFLSVLQSSFEKEKTNILTYIKDVHLAHT